MEGASEDDRHRGSRARLAGVVLLVMMASALGLRFIHITDPPLTYQPARQYHSLLIVRNWYLGNGGSHPTQIQRAAAEARTPLGEPPIMEGLTLAGWELAGHEVLWLGGAISACLWVGGSGFVYALGRRLQGRLAGLAAVAVFLFLPQALAASRALQPDPLLVVGLAGAVLALVVDDERRTTRSLVVAGAACGFAVLVKFVGGFYVLPVMAGLIVARSGWRCLLARRTVALVAMTLAPSAAYVLYGTVLNPFLAEESSQRFVGWLLTTNYFWGQWLGLAVTMVGIGPLLVGLAGVVAARGRTRPVLWGLVVGYLAFGLVFDFTLSTSVYYQLPLVLVVAVGVASSVGALTRWLRATNPPSLVQVGVAAAAGAALVSPLLVGSVIPPGADPDARARVEAGRPVGDAIGHDSKVILIGPADEQPLRFYGLVGGSDWPEAGNRYVQRTEGTLGVSNARELATIERSMGGADFVVADIEEMAGRPGLQAYLDQRYPVVAQNRYYRVYDLRHAAG